MKITPLESGQWQRVDRATADVFTGAAVSLFTIATGRVLVKLILGEVTTVIQTQANATKLTFDPTDTGASTDLCATLDITADAVGRIYTISGTVGDALRDALQYGSGGLTALPLILKPGSILLDCAASNTGSVKWTIWYVPLEDGATITAA